MTGLDCNAGQREGAAREDIDDDLLVDRRDLAVLGSLAEDDVAAKKACEEGIIRT